jgi:NADPH:quinone reductase-like Zn-dependent oxidoreductase
VLVRIHASSVNSWDWELLRAVPFVNRVMFGLFRPKIQSLGADVAGTVEAVGSGVSRFKAGDEVYGDLSNCGWGGFAEYVSAREEMLAYKPTMLTFEQAAAVPQAGVLALQGLRCKGRIRPGDKVLINGASGGVGTFAVQLAKYYGAEVTGVCRTEKMELVRSLGAEHVIDYTAEDFTRSDEEYDLIVDVSASRSIFECLRALKPGGRYIIIGGRNGVIMQTMLLGPLLSRLGSRKATLLMHRPNYSDLEVLAKLLDEGMVKPIISHSYPLNDVPQAIQDFADHRARGKFVIRV